ncbi:hypothetical protein AYK24_01245 [Thermoplasmatales archaeon SG8-52-4]|nr:MAG: hypothetical protein AYK24_01245 [Thermoplasmatales archaeon SG8-52-4]
MKIKKLQMSVGILVLLVIFVCGCNEQKDNDSKENDNGETSGNEFRMNTSQLYNDIDVQTDYDTFMTMNYKSMDEGDRLIFMDTISSIRFLNDVDATEITFRITVGETGWKAITFFFTGNITSSYKISDFVRITLTIKHVTMSDVQGMDVDIEIFDEAWESEEYYRSHMTTLTGGSYPMPIDIIEKI